MTTSTNSQAILGNPSLQQGIAFINGLGMSIVGNDSNLTSDDMYTSTQTGAGFIVSNPNGSASVLGQPVSNQQTMKTLGLPPIVFYGGMALLAWYLLKTE